MGLSLCEKLLTIFRRTCEVGKLHEAMVLIRAYILHAINGPAEAGRCQFFRLPRSAILMAAPRDAGTATGGFQPPLKAAKPLSAASSGTLLGSQDPSKRPTASLKATPRDFSAPPAGILAGRKLVEAVSSILFSKGPFVLAERAGRIALPRRPVLADGSPLLAYAGIDAHRAIASLVSESVNFLEQEAAAMSEPVARVMLMYLAPLELPRAAQAERALLQRLLPSGAP